MGIFRKSTADKVKYRNKDRVERGEFRGHEIEELEMPDTVRIIGESGFRECRKLRRASLSNSLCELGAYAFRDCDMLENIVMPGEMKYPDGENGLLGIGCFEGCGLLRQADRRHAAAGVHRPDRHKHMGRLRCGHQTA